MQRNKWILSWSLLLLLVIGLAACGDSGSDADVDGDAADGDGTDGDEPDGDEPDGDDACPECDFLTGSWCMADPEGAACDQIPLDGVQIIQADESSCAFTAVISFTNGVTPAVFTFDGCDIEELSLFNDTCELSIDSTDSKVTVDCPNLCSFTLSQDDCELGCLCDTEDACCDGCQPINQGGACNDNDSCTQTDTCNAGFCIGADPVVCVAQDQCHVAGQCDSATGECTNPFAADDTACDDNEKCTTNDVCTSGVCGGEAVVCIAQDDCHVAGLCNSDTGLCENPPKANGSTCDGLGTGIMESGVCRNGECKALDACMLRDYGQPLGYSCNFDEDCASGICTADTLFFKGSSSAYVCTQACNPDSNPCPNGFFCTENYDKSKAPLFLEFVCLPETGPLPLDGSQDLLEPCNIDANCESGVCAFDGWLSYCSLDCYVEDSTKEGPNDNLCGPCGTCEENPFPIKDDKRPSYYCVARDRAYPGGLCTSNLDCITGICYDNHCSTWCGDYDKGQDDCMVGFTCTDVGFPLGEICIPNDEIGTNEENEPCTESFSCADGYYCDLPPSNGMMGILVDPDLNEAVAGDFYSRSNEYAYFTDFSYTAEVSGTYYLIIQPMYFKDYFPPQSAYRLNVTTGADPTTSIDEIEPNDYYTTAQALTLPISVIGMLELFDVDWYTIDLQAGETVTVQGLPVADSGTCLAKKAFGEACSFDAECETGVCYSGKCSEECTMVLTRGENDSCPTDYTCVFGVAMGKNDSKLDSPLVCVPDAEYGDKDFGEPCRFDWECADELCYYGECNQFCEFTPVKGAGDTCPDNFDCVDTDGTPTKAGLTVCIPSADLDLAFGEACTNDYQCESGRCLNDECNLYCDQASTKADPVLCPSGYECIIEVDGLNSYNRGCWAESELDLEFGAACEEDYQCQSDFCYDDACNVLCSVLVKGPILCPDDYTCHYVSNSSGKADPLTACLADDTLNRDFGEACENDYECTSNFCYFGKCNVMCDMSKADCPTGYECLVSYYEPSTFCAASSD